MTLYLMNTTGIFTTKKSLLIEYREISKDEAKLILEDELKRDGVISAIGHQGTTDFLNILLDTNFPTQRHQVDFKVGDSAICFQLKSRLPEGTVLNKEELEKYEYKFTRLIIRD